MKIGVISDLHIDHFDVSYPSKIIQALTWHAEGKDLSLLILAGDIADYYQLVFDFIESLQDSVSIPVYFIPGNHDYWSDDEDTWEIYSYYCQHPSCLMTQPIKLSSDWGLVGHSAWYNHAGNFGQHQEAFLEAGVYQGYTWSDKLYTRWQMSDRQLSNLFAKQIEQDIKRLSTKHYLLVTHIVSHFDLQIPADDRYQVDIDYFNAFITTDDLNRIYDKYSVPYSFMGHVHRQGRHLERGTHFFLTCLASPGEWLNDRSLIEQIEHCLQVIEIEG